MHPVLILVPAAALILGPRLWVGQVLKRHNREDASVSLNAVELARDLLDQHGLQMVKVEVTDRGDHYDPRDRSVRLARDKYDRKTLTAVTTAAHEVSHALQHAEDYGPFLWRTRLAKVAQVTGEVGSVLLFAVPAAALMTRNPVPPIIIGVAALSMLGTGVAAQLAALPSELDASFNRALPMLRGGYIDASQTQDAHQILLACSLTYVASSLVAILNIWPWIGVGGFMRRPVRKAVIGLTPAHMATSDSPTRKRRLDGFQNGTREIRSKTVLPARRGEQLLRRVFKPLIRGWLSLAT